MELANSPVNINFHNEPKNPEIHVLNFFKNERLIFNYKDEFRSDLLTI
jgi:hypothetical protein